MGSYGFKGNQKPHCCGLVNLKNGQKYSGLVPYEGVYQKKCGIVNGLLWITQDNP